MYSPAAIARAQAIQAEIPDDRRERIIELVDRVDDKQQGGRLNLSNELSVRFYLPASLKRGSRFRH